MASLVRLPERYIRYHSISIYAEIQAGIPSWTFNVGLWKRAVGWLVWQFFFHSQISTNVNRQIDYNDRWFKQIWRVWMIGFVWVLWGRHEVFGDLVQYLPWLFDFALLKTPPGAQLPGARQTLCGTCSRAFRPSGAVQTWWSPSIGYRRVFVGLLCWCVLCFGICMCLCCACLIKMSTAL